LAFVVLVGGIIGMLHWVGLGGWTTEMSDPKRRLTSVKSFIFYKKQVRNKTIRILGHGTVKHLSGVSTKYS